MPDLAAHVRPDWWRHIFNAMYLKTDGDVLDEAATRAEVDLAVSFARLAPEDRLLDLCCGQGRHTLELARRGFHRVEGLDQSRYLLRRARAAARREGLAVRFREGDARAVGELPPGFDAVLVMGNSFGYFESEDDDLRVLRGVRAILRPGGTLLLDISDGDHLRGSFSPRSWEWIGPRMFVCRERWLSPDGRMVSREVVTDTDRGVVKDQFYAERLYSSEALAELIDRAGFQRFTVHRRVEGQSQRNQDLGMMAHRLFVTAVAGEPAAARARPATAREREIVVVLGDPSQPDAVKPGGRFGPEDGETVRRMQSALAERRRRVRYLSDHEQLLDDLRAVDRGALVVNLCDEGLRNHARHELHVPALLDALGLAYTGAGPQCLARCFDKAVVRGLARELAIPVAPAVVLGPGDALPAITRPVIVKPNHGDGSFGIDERCVAYDAGQAAEAIAYVRGVVGEDALVLVEELLVGKEIGAGILGNPPGPHRVLPLVEEDYSSLAEGLPHICSYRAKWDMSSPYWHLRSLPARIPDAIAEQVRSWSLLLFARLECRDYARFDWRLDAEGRPCLLEVNPNPGWCWDGHLAKMAALDGMSYADLLDVIITGAEARLERSGAGR